MPRRSHREAGYVQSNPGRAPGIFYWVPRVALAATQVGLRAAGRGALATPGAIVRGTRAAPGVLVRAARATAGHVAHGARSGAHAVSRRAGRIAQAFRRPRSPSVTVENMDDGDNVVRVASAGSHAPSFEQDFLPRTVSNPHFYEYSEVDSDSRCPSAVDSTLGGSLAPTPVNTEEANTRAGSRSGADSAVGPSLGAPTPVVDVEDNQHPPSPPIPSPDVDETTKLHMSYEQFQILLHELKRFKSEVEVGELMALDADERARALRDVERLADERGWYSFASMLSWDDLFELVLKNGDWNSFFYAFDHIHRLSKKVRRDVAKYFKSLRHRTMDKASMQQELREAIGPRGVELVIQLDRLLDYARHALAADTGRISKQGQRSASHMRSYLRFLDSHDSLSEWILKEIDRRCPQARPLPLAVQDDIDLNDSFSGRTYAEVEASEADQHHDAAPAPHGENAAQGGPFIMPGDVRVSSLFYASPFTATAALGPAVGPGPQGPMGPNGPYSTIAYADDVEREPPLFAQPQPRTADFYASSVAVRSRVQYGEEAGALDVVVEDAPADNLEVGHAPAADLLFVEDDDSVERSVSVPAPSFVDPADAVADIDSGEIHPGRSSLDLLGDRMIVQRRMRFFDLFAAGDDGQIPEHDPWAGFAGDVGPVGIPQGFFEDEIADIADGFVDAGTYLDIEDRDLPVMSAALFAGCPRTADGASTPDQPILCPTPEHSPPRPNRGIIHPGRQSSEGSTIVVNAAGEDPSPENLAASSPSNGWRRMSEV